MISSLCWVPRGVAREQPLEHDVAEDGAVPAADGAAPLVDADTAVVEEFGLDRYDDEVDPHDLGALPMFGRKMMMYHASNDEDPYITLQDGEEDEEDEDRDDLAIRSTDLLVVAAMAQDDMANIEVHLYEEEAQNMYPHHDIVVPSYPLAMDWLGYRPGSGSEGNLVAVGTFEPVVEIWDLDVLNAVTPIAVLGDDNLAETSDRPKKLKKQKRKLAEANEWHTDAILAVSCNRCEPHILASGSADHSVRLWDLHAARPPCVQALSHHDDKVQAVAWHATEASVLLSGSFDGTARVLDVRAARGRGAQHFALSADVERTVWCDEDSFLASTEDGRVVRYDVRAPKAPVWHLSAHDGAATGLAVNPVTRSLFATCSTDKVSCRASSHPAAPSEPFPWGRARGSYRPTLPRPTPATFTGRR